MRGSQSRVPEDEKLIAACNRQSVDGHGYQSRWALYPSPESPELFIKYRHEDDGILAEARNQTFIYNALQEMPEQNTLGIGVPEIYHIFSRDGIVYIVMEYIHGETIKELLDKDPTDSRINECYDQVTAAINLFLSIPVNTIPPGPVGGGIIRHPIFKDTIASIKYSSVSDLQKHLNAVANTRNELVDFSKESLCFCFSDLYEGNFIRTDEGSLYIVDFEHASILPASFMTYALDQPRPICDTVKDRVRLPLQNLAAMRAAGYYFMISWRKIGMRSLIQ